VTDSLRALCAEPRAGNCPERVTRDWVLVGALVLTAVLEGLLRPDVVWRPLVTVLAVGLAFTLLWRRTHPLAVVAVVCGSAIALDLAVMVLDPAMPPDDTVGLYTMAFLLLLPYALYRWASGRDVIYGTLILLALFGSAMWQDYTTFGEAVAAFVFFAFPGVLGASVRFWTTSRSRELDQVRSHERAQLARELHDTVAHHVSAMVIRAQAGRVLAAADPVGGPAAAVEALEGIEEEGARTLEEMRAMVGALRDGGGGAELAPLGGVADLERLARGVRSSGVAVVLTCEGTLDDLAPSVDAAVYRIVQEAVTNTMRHARRATRIDVRVDGEDGCVRVVVQDDGVPVTRGPAREGYGLSGMRERAELLGGTLEAGPAPDREGWLVSAVLPRERVGAGVRPRAHR
jgi:hypothetical protein